MDSNRLEVATSERVFLKLPLAGAGHRALAYLLDVALLFAVWLVLYFVLTLVQSDVLGSFQALSGAVQALAALAVFAAQWVYWTASEVLGGGRTLGKRALGIRVRREDGRPLTVLDSALRNLLRFVDFLPVLYAVGVLTMLLDPRQRRLGDLVAGTVLVRDRKLDLSRYEVDAQPSSVAASKLPLSAADHELLSAFLARSASLDAEARVALTAKFLSRYAPELEADARQLLAADAARAEALLRERISGAR